MSMTYARRLLVEGDTDKRIIPQLIAANGIQWEIKIPGKKKEFVVEIMESTGYEGMTSDWIETQIQTLEISSLVDSHSILGIIVDADYSAQQRWQSICDRCSETRILSNIDWPEYIPPEGFITQVESGLKLGIWIMPDNQAEGMIETFLAYLVPEGETDPLWRYTQEAVKTAQDLNAPFKEKHIDKAKIHTWLAWQDEPGQQLHGAVQQKILDPKHPRSKPFVDWFRRLYDL